MAEKKEAERKGKKPAAEKKTKASVEQIEEKRKKALVKTQVKTAPKGGEEETKMKKKILFVASEALPYAATGGLGEVIGSLPKALAQNGNLDVRVILPLYSEMPAELRSKLTFLCSYRVGLAWRNLYCGIHRLEQDGVTFYFIDNEYYFKRDGLYGFYDDGERFAFFCKAVMDSFYFTGFTPDIIHAHDWQAALVPIYLTCKYRYAMKSIFTIHNIEYQGKYDLSILGDVFDLPPEAGAYVEYDGAINLVKGAIECSDLVSTVSPTYAQELHYGFFAHGMQDIIARNSFKVRGILNGIDDKGYDPATDPAIFEAYSKDDLSGKAKDKEELQRLANLPLEPDTPLVALVTRLVAHKGVDLVTYVVENILKQKVQLVILGKGDRRYEDFFLWLEAQYKGKVSAMITYNKDLSRKIYAGADLFLMPSKSEPCGLAQMIACRYGTVPIVRATGGLKDSIQDCGMGQGNGFVFQNYDAVEMEQAVNRALALYDNKEDWKDLQTYNMGLDFSWKKSAGEYEKMYSELLG